MRARTSSQSENEQHIYKSTKNIVITAACFTMTIDDSSTSAHTCHVEVVNCSFCAQLGITEPSEPFPLRAILNAHDTARHGAWRDEWNGMERREETKAKMKTKKESSRKEGHL